MDDLFDVNVSSSAVFSTCGTYRYRLEREVAMDGPTFAYFGVNPSTADATINDATVRKWIGFTKVNGGRRLIVGNVFAYRSTDVKGLRLAADPYGPDNPMHLKSIIDDADILVPCWGDRKKLDRRLQSNFDWIKARFLLSGKPVMTFGFTSSGDPKHPLMLGYNTPLIDWVRQG
ncbi:DUF1643 domain-containing protein [Paraburkholderia elongata]|uniref:DUF1643 domain-containing protein n=1 Tax=Paraburkholderia elongata TaxID=2675747 RepID=A0A972SL29_9BURK|nr:DUF1643 domain-containing protein [Paraburkholderia elongata]NPT59683.1 DUF1643 domain-containing protein [Paraburkholderia elongata]